MPKQEIIRCDFELIKRFYRRFLKSTRPLAAWRKKLFWKDADSALHPPAAFKLAVEIEQ